MEPAPPPAEEQASASTSLPTLLTGGDVALQLLSFLRTADIFHLLQGSRSLHDTLLRSPTNSDSQRLWEAVLASDLARYGVPPHAAAGGWATGRGLVRPPAVRWCMQEEPSRYSGKRGYYDPPEPDEFRGDRSGDEDDSCGGMERPAEDVDGEAVVEIMEDSLDEPRALRLGDVKPKAGMVFDLEGGPEGKGVGYRLGLWDKEGPADDAREWSPVNGWRTLRIRGRSPPARSDPSMAIVRINRGRDRVLIVWGGLLESGVRWNDLWMLPLSEEDEAREGLMWVALSNGGPGNPPPRKQHSFTASKNALVVFGGKDSMTETLLRDAWIYDLTTLGSQWVKVDNNGNERNAPYPVFEHAAATATRVVDGEEREGVLVVGGRQLHEEDDRGAPFFWWRRSNDACRRSEPIRRVWWLDVAEQRWSTLMLYCAPCLRPARAPFGADGRRRDDGDEEDKEKEKAAPGFSSMRECDTFGNANFEGGGHHRLLRVPTLPHVFVGLASSRAGGALVINLLGKWWRWLPGPLRSRRQRKDEDRNPSEERPPNELAAVWLRHGSLFVSWKDKDVPCYLPWIFPWLVDPAPRRAPRWRAVSGGEQDESAQEIAVVVEDRGHGVIRLTGPSRGRPGRYTLEQMDAFRAAGMDPWM